MQNRSPSSTRNASSSSAETVEARFPAALLAVMTLALIFGGLITCGLMWFLSRSQPPSQVQTSRAVGTAILLLDIGMAIFLRTFFGNTFVRADNKGVSARSGFAREKFVAWESVARIETQKTANLVSGFLLFDATGNEVLRVRPESRPPLDKAKVVAFIEKKLSARR